MFIDINKTNYMLSQTNEYIELIVYSAIAFLVPFLLGQPQWLVGTLVNASLVLSSLNLKNMKLLPVIILPSIAVFIRGIIFGPFTIFLLYMIPFLWIGNTLLVGSMKLNTGKWLRLLLGVGAKTIFIALMAFILVKLSIIPDLFITTMGIMQLYTAVAGGIVALSIQYAKEKVTIGK